MESPHTKGQVIFRMYVCMGVSQSRTEKPVFYREIVIFRIFKVLELAKLIVLMQPLHDGVRVLHSECVQPPVSVTKLKVSPHH